MTDRHLVLVGLPGAGKSAVGRRTAPRLDRPFIDLDREIERAAGLSIAEIFTRGESAFRALERDATAALVAAPPAVIAPGGGWIIVPETVALLRPVARTIYLKVEPVTALRRLGPTVVRRPLLRGETADALAAMQGFLLARRRAYEAADEVIDTEHLSLQQVMDAVVELAGRMAAY